MEGDPAVIRRAPAIAFIALYLGILGYGIVAHMFSMGTGSHVGMYYIVWDMFCGWSGFEQRHHLIAEGESGQFYDITTGPWGDVRPYGPLERLHYDTYAMHTPRIAQNILKQTAHEPITKVYMIEEYWAKKYNLPDAYWAATHQEPKDPKRYYSTRMTLTNDCQKWVTYPTWLHKQQYVFYMDNPKLQMLAKNSRQFLQPNSVYQANQFVPIGTLPSTSLDTGAIQPASFEMITE